MSDRIAVMNRGKIVEYGPAEDVYTMPKDVLAGVACRRAGSRPAPMRSAGRNGASTRMSSPSLSKRLGHTRGSGASPGGGLASPPPAWGGLRRDESAGDGRSLHTHRRSASLPDRREDLRRGGHGRGDREAARLPRAVRPRANQWTSLTPLPRSSQRRGRHQLDGRFWVIGGDNSPRQTAVRSTPYDIAGGRWREEARFRR